MMEKAGICEYFEFKGTIFKNPWINQIFVYNKCHYTEKSNVLSIKG